MTLEKQPKSMVIMGAGAIGVEFAYFYNAFGTTVTLIEMMPRILPVEDEEVSALLAERASYQGRGPRAHGHEGREDRGDRTRGSR